MVDGLELSRLFRTSEKDPIYINLAYEKKDLRLRPRFKAS